MQSQTACGAWTSYWKGDKHNIVMEIGNLRAMTHRYENNDTPAQPQLER